MSKPVIALATIAAVAAGGYTVAWYKAANEFKTGFVQWVSDTNKSAKPMIKNGELLQYGSVETTGFPFAMKLVVSKPTLTAPIDAILRNAPNKNIDQAKIPADLSWIEEIHYGDNITFASNLIGSEFTITFNGNTNLKGTINGQVRHSMNKEITAPLECRLKTIPSGFLVVRPNFTDAESFFKMFQSADCSEGPSVLKDATTNTPLASSGKSSYSISHVQAAGNRAASLKVHFEDVSYTAAADPIVNDLLQAFGQATGNPQEPLPYSLVESGKTNMNFDLAYNGPDTIAAYQDRGLKTHIDINALDITSSLFNFSTSFHLAVEPDGANRKALLSLHTKANVAERYDQVLAQQTKKAISDLQKTEGKTGKELEVAQDMAKLGPPEALVKAVLPSFHVFGEMSADIDANFEGPNEEANFFTQGHHKLSTFNLLTSLYGIKASGEAVGSVGKPPSGSLKLTCVNCDAMIDDAGAYAIRFTNYMDAMHPEKKTAHAPKSFYDGLKIFVHDVALNGKDPAAKDLNFDAAMKDTGDFTISGKQIMEVMQSYMTNVAANVPVQPAPQIPNQQLPPLVRPPQQ